MEPENKETPQNGTAGATTADIAAIIEKALSKKGGDSTQALDLLARSVADSMSRLQVAETRAQELESKVAKDEDVAALTSYRALNLTAEQIAEKLASLSTLEQQAATHARESTAREACESLEWTGVRVLTDQMERLGFSLEKDGDSYVAVQGEERKALDEFVTEKLPDYAIAIRGVPSGKGSVPYPGQKSGGKPPKTDVLSGYLKSQYPAFTPRNPS